MRFIVMMKCDNAAFGDTQEECNSETARTLRRLAQKIERGELDKMEAMQTCFCTLTDSNGNSIGHATYARDDYYIAEVQHPGFRRDWKSR